MDFPLHWFALRVRPRAEKVVAESLSCKGFEEFLPLYRHRRRWSDRVVETELPLFPGYVFSRFSVERRLPILTVPGVMHIVSVGKVPQPIAESEMASLRALVESSLDVEPWPFQYLGQRVRIVSGPLAGAEGVLDAVTAKHRLVVSITLLQRSVAVEIPEGCAWPVSSSDYRLSVS